jgi:hypothetical protein
MTDVTASRLFIYIAINGLSESKSVKGTDIGDCRTFADLMLIPPCATRAASCRRSCNTVVERVFCLRSLIRGGEYSSSLRRKILS